MLNKTVKFDEMSNKLSYLSYVNAKFHELYKLLFGLLRMSAANNWQTSCFYLVE